MRILALFLILTSLGACSRVSVKEYPLSLPLPEAHEPVVQQTRDPQARLRNPLYLPARRILADEFGSAELEILVEQMRARMHETGGIGISANQLGKRLQVFVIEAIPSNPRYKVLGPVPFQAFLNPRIVAASQKRKNFWHGCLSAVGEPRGNVATYEWVEVEAAGVDGKIHHEKLDGLAAVIFQHELRHLLGGTYLDKAKQLVAKESLDKQLENHELPFFETADASLPLLLDDYVVGDSLEQAYERRAQK